MARTPIVSVIVPTYNREHLVGRAIRSVLAQTFRHWELLVVDDGSTDGTAALIRSMGDKRVRLVETDHRGGNAARNTGIRAATGRYLTFLDSDDEYEPWKLERQVQRFSHPRFEELGVVICGIVTADGNHWYQPDLHIDELNGWVAERVVGMYHNTGVGTPTIMVDGHLLTSDLLFDETFPAFQDRDFLVRWSLHHQVDEVRQPLVIVHPNGIDHVHQGSNLIRGLTMLMAKHWGLIQMDPTARSNAHRMQAFLCFNQDHDLGAFRRNIRSALSARRWNVKDYLWFCVSLLGTKPLTWAIRRIIQ